MVNQAIAFLQNKLIIHVDVRFSVKSSGFFDLKSF